MLYEKNTIIKKHDKNNIHMGLAYPNVYNAAMSSLGYNILYDFINKREDSWCERIIYPSTKSIESNTSIRHFDIISFTIQFEQDYFNVMEMLKKSEIPMKRNERSPDDPLIIAGGPSPTANPMPLSDYIDMFIIGEGEEVITAILDTYSKNQKDLKEYLNINGIYIPQYNNKTKIALINDLNTTHHITNPIISKSSEKDNKSIFNNTIMLNVSRGCMRGCRFCMAGYLYRPTRETNCNKLIDTALKTRQNTGLNKITLIGAAVTDYTDLDKLINELEANGFEISTPSLRIETLTKNTLRTLKKSGLKTITLAPESITKLRKSINKNIPDEKIFEVIKNANELNFKIKLYFLIGIPGETKEDIKKLIRYMKKIADNYDNPKNVKFSVNPLIPKPQTPLQWEPFNYRDIKNKTRYIKKEMKNYNIKCESPKNSLIQYILSCGDEKIGNLIEKSLTQKINMKEWEENIPHYDIADELPWKNITVSVNENFLKRENKRIKKEKQTPWCQTNTCYNCGACEN